MRHLQKIMIKGLNLFIREELGISDSDFLLLSDDSLKILIINLYP